MANYPARRIELRNLTVSQKLLVFTILMSVGLGYLSAMANLFASDASADGKQTVKLDDFAQVYREGGFGKLKQEVEKSLGKEDVIRKYHGTGDLLKFEVAMNGVMKPILIEAMSDENEAAKLSAQVIEWAKLPEPQRKHSFEKGMPVDAEEMPDFAKYKSFFAGDASKPNVPKGVELKPVISEMFKDQCASCHSTNGSVSHAPLQTFAQINAYCTADHGVSLNKLALTTHVHLLGFTVLFALTGFLFSLTSFPGFIRLIFVPWTLFFQIIEISCWWLAKLDSRFAEAIFYLGPIVGIGMLIQVTGTGLDLIFRRRTE